MTNREYANRFLSNFIYHIVSVCYHCGVDNMYNNNPCCPFKKCVHSSTDVEKWMNKKRKNHLLENDTE